MELDDLKRSWKGIDQKLDLSIHLNARLLRESLLGKVRTALIRLALMAALEGVLLLFVMLWLGGFVWRHVGEARFLIPGLVLHLCVIALVVALVRQMVLASRVDYGANIVTIQRRLESLRAERIRVTKWVLLLAPLAGTPLMIVAAKGLLGVDLYAAFGVRWVVANLIFGLAVIAVVWRVARRYADRVRSSSFLQGLMRDLAGYNLEAATRFLHALSQFEHEQGPTAAKAP